MATRWPSLEASKSQQVAHFLTAMLEGVGPSVALGRDTRMLQEILEKTTERVGNDLTNQPAVEAELENIIGGGYWALGNYERAEAMHREALAVSRSIEGSEEYYTERSIAKSGRQPYMWILPIPPTERSIIVP